LRLHVFSDLHLEFGPLELTLAVRAGQLAELVLLAGDIDIKRRGPDWAAATFTQRVAIIGGNHEAYGDSLFATIAAGRSAAERVSRGRQNEIRFLERETWTMAAADGTPVRLIAATLWTDFELFGTETRSGVMARAHAQMSDFHQIRILDELLQETRRLEPMDVFRLHSMSRQFLETELGTPFDGLTIVMTHHAPSMISISDRFRGDLLTAAYASNLDEVVERFQPALWVHGHTHDSFDYRIGRTRVICNPRGYAPDELNPSFDPALVVEIS
jgi:Icc-related predicted phosphoesterase